MWMESIAGLMQPTVDEIDGLWIHPAYQGRGIGSSLLAFGEERHPASRISARLADLLQPTTSARSTSTARAATPCSGPSDTARLRLEEESFAMERSLDGGKYLMPRTSPSSAPSTSAAIP
jgi:GNAT superfamily N-acetyltransferase